MCKDPCFETTRNSVKSSRDTRLPPQACRIGGHRETGTRGTPPSHVLLVWQHLKVHLLQAVHLDVVQDAPEATQGVQVLATRVQRPHPRHEARRQGAGEHDVPAGDVFLAQPYLQETPRLHGEGQPRALVLIFVHRGPADRQAARVRGQVHDGRELGHGSSGVQGARGTASQSWYQKTKRSGGSP